MFPSVSGLPSDREAECGPVALGTSPERMAKTKQTARRSTGGRQARDQLTTLNDARGRREKVGNGDSVDLEDKEMDFLVFEGNGQFALKFVEEAMGKTKEEKLSRVLDPLVFRFCRRNRGLKVTAKSAVWWGLLDRQVEGEDTAREDYTVRWVKFDPDLGVEGELIRGGFLGKEGDRSEPFPIRMYSLGGFDRGLHVPSQLRELFEKCTKQVPGRWVKVGPLGSRRAVNPEHLAPYVVQAEKSLLYRSSEVIGCVPMAAANAVEPYDSEAAQKMSECPPNLVSLAQFASYLQEEVRNWRAENPFKKMARETSKTYMGTGEKLSWLLQQEDGIFLVQPLIKHAGNDHIIGVDCGRKVIYDPLEQNMLRLQEEVLGLCAGGAVNQCMGIGDVRQLKAQEKPQSARKRLRRGKKGRKQSEASGSSSSKVW